MSEALVETLRKILLEPIGFGRDDFFLDHRNSAAVLALFRGQTFLESEVLLILRSPDLIQNPGQVAFPGGGMDAIDESDPVRTALRETFEEVGLTLNLIQALGTLPKLPTVTGQIVVEPVLAVWTGTAAHPLVLQTSEVAHAEWVPVKLLRATQTTEKRWIHGAQMELPVFQWGEQRMWGLTAMIFDLILKRYDKLFS
jgi:8-oxo-dGTP pyrophosphatase MutT (NUDIX family)